MLITGAPKAVVIVFRGFDVKKGEKPDINRITDTEETPTKYWQITFLKQSQHFISHWLDWIHTGDESSLDYTARQLFGAGLVELKHLLSLDPSLQLS
jgi:hypothetical protein